MSIGQCVAASAASSTTHASPTVRCRSVCVVMAAVMYVTRSVCHSVYVTRSLLLLQLVHDVVMVARAGSGDVKPQLSQSISWCTVCADGVGT